MTEYILGIDIGSTKSQLALFDTNGNYVDFGHWGPLNHEFLPGSYTQFEREFKRFIKRTIDKYSIPMNRIAYSAFGIAGVNTKKEHSVISGIISKLGFQNFTLCNDAYLGIYAGIKTGQGICAINGSGCNLAGINKNGDMLLIGGIGHLVADKGGGTYIGERIVSAVYRELFRKGEPTCMTPLIFEKLGITSKYDYVEKIYEKTADGTFNLDKYSRMIFEAAKQNDCVAVGIIKEIADSYADSISCMIDEMQFPPEEELHIVLEGSVFAKGEHPLLIDTLTAKVNEDNPGRYIKHKVLDVPNAAGAVICALNAFNEKTDYYDKIREQLK